MFMCNFYLKTMNKLFFYFTFILLFTISNGYSQNIIHLNDVPFEATIMDIDSKYLDAVGADYVYVRVTDNHLILEKDGAIVKDINFLKNSIFEGSSVSSVNFFYNKFMKKGKIELFIHGNDGHGQYSLITDEDGTIYFEGRNYYGFRFSGNSIIMNHQVEGVYYKKFIKFDTNELGKEKESLTSYNIYPNPTNYQIKINGKYDRFKLYDINGRLVLDGANQDNTINVCNLAKGKYILEISNNNNILRTSKVFID